MAATTILPLLVCLIVSTIPQTFSQTFSPQNIETYYPSSPPPVIVPPPPPPTPFIDPPKIPQPAFPPSRNKPSSAAAVGRAIGVTAASTVVLSALLFFLLLRRSRRKQERENDNITGGGTSPSLPRPHQPENFRRFSGNLRGVIVDEDGLDVLYWRNLQEGDNRRSFKKQSYRSLKDEQRQESKRIASGNKDRTTNNINNSPPVQEAPLLRGASSSSQSPFWSQPENQAIIQTASSVSPAMSVKVEARQNSSSSAPQIPPATVAVEAVPAAPPPPPQKNRIPPPPPPSVKPPPDGKRAASDSIGTRSSSSSSSNGNGQVKLKQLHWDKVNANAQHSMVWDKMDKGSFRFDGDLMEALFGYVATNKKSPPSDGQSSIPGQEKPPAQIFILDKRKSQNTAIVVKSLGVRRQEIIDALIDGHGLNSDTLEKLARITPTDEEISQILAFNGEPAKLADAESFLYNLLKAVPSAFPRLNAMLFRLNHDAEVLSIKESLQSLESACKEMRTRGLFLKLLEAVLKAGNRLNAGTARGNAQAFNLTALTKLSDVKSSDGKTTLLQFVVQEVVRAEGKRCVLNRNRNLNRTSSSSSSMNQSSDQTDGEREYMILGLPVIGGLSAEFSNVKKAATLEYDLLAKTSTSLAAQLVRIRDMLEQCGGDRGFMREMTGFLDTAELEMKAVKEEQTRVMELVKKTTDYYQVGSSKGAGPNSNQNHLQLFVIVRDFLQMVDQVCVDIARNVQKRKPASHVGSGPSYSGSPRAFRFPKLPANFMSDDSRNSLDDDESDGR